MTRPASRRKAQSVPIPLTRTSGPFNATNNALDGYETNCTDRWRYIKTPLQSKRRYLKETLTPQRLEPKARYIKPSTLPWKGMQNITPEKERDNWAFLVISYLFNNSILTLASKVLWQAPHQWSSPTEEVPLTIQVSEPESGSIWVHITRLTKLRFIRSRCGEGAFTWTLIFW